jgi:hypothetical protein
MMIVIVGLLREAAEAQFCSVTTFFLVFVAGIFVISAFLHPQVNNKMKIINKKYHTVGTVPQSNKKKIADRGDIYTPNTQIHNRSRS